MSKVDLSQYKNAMSRKNQVLRLVWSVVWNVFARPLPRSVGCGWKRFLLRLFGAKLASTAVVYSSTRIYMPWQLEMGEYSCLADGVDCYNVAPVRIGRHTTVSQRTYLCTASHDIRRGNLPLTTAPIVIGEGVWVAAEAFVGPGVTVGEGAVVAARACVVKDVEPWTVVGGNPAKFLKKRTIQ